MGRIFHIRRKEDEEMQIEGMPETFWIVTTPTAHSELGDICFACNFKQFALQVRGGLDVDAIVGLYADEEDAKDTAKKLIAARRAK